MRAEAPRLPRGPLATGSTRQAQPPRPVPVLVALLLAIVLVLLAGPLVRGPATTTPVDAESAWVAPATPAKASPQPSRQPAPLPAVQLGPLQAELGHLRLSADLAGAGPALAQLPLSLQHTLHEEIRLACTLVHRPDGVSARVDLDAMRRPWLDALQQRCAGLPAEALQEAAHADPALQAWRAQLPATIARLEDALTAERAAWQLLRQSADAVLLHEALRHLQLAGRLPREHIFPAASRPVSVDLEALLLPAADLVACQRSASCGPDGLWTLYSCAQLGCPPGSDLAAALHWQLPRVPYENVRRLAGWLLEGAKER